jgi:hypothetical protein
MRDLKLYSVEGRRDHIELRAEPQTGRLSLMKKNERRTKRLGAFVIGPWCQIEDQVIDKNAFLSSPTAGAVRGLRIELATIALYLDYEQHGKHEKLRQAYAENEAALKALENTLKKRLKP